MPANIIKSFASKSGKSEKEVELLWQKAKAAAKEQGEEENYAYITGILKKMLNMNESFREFIGEARPTNIMGLMDEIKKLPSIEKRVDLWSQMDGFAGLFRGKDGNAYEITIRPAEFAQHDGIKRKTKKR